MRIPLKEKITLDRLRRIEKAESILRDFLGDSILFRVRDHGELAWLDFLKRILAVIKKKDGGKIKEKLKRVGYRYLTVDLEGYVPAGLR